MSETAGRAAGVMVLRLWTELGEGIRVRVTSTTDVESSQSSTSYASTRAEVIDLVGAWLDQLGAARSGGDEGGPVT